MSVLDDTSTLSEVKQYLSENSEKGCNCPGCDRLVKIYKYKMNSGMALAMISMYRLTKEKQPKGGWLHVQQEFAKELGLNANALHYSLMKWWGLLIASTKNEDPTKRSSGYWCITEKGRQFVEGKIQVPERVHIYDNRRVGFSEVQINIHQALNNKFDYRELMEGL